jgi:CRP-like cAMP-binding protein
MDISNFPFFRGLNEANRVSLVANTRRLGYSRCETIVSKGARFSHVYFIILGRIKESNFTHSGKEIVFNTLSEGDCFGIVSPLRSDVSYSNFVASVDTEVFAVRAREFIRLLRTNSSVSDSVIAEIIRVAHKFSNKLYEMRALDVSARTRAELLRHTTQNANANGSDYSEINDLPTHEEIANTIFTHREAVTREISKLRRDGVIVKTDQNHLIANVSLLGKMVTEFS